MCKIVAYAYLPLVPDGKGVSTRFRCLDHEEEAAVPWAGCERPALCLIGKMEAVIDRGVEKIVAEIGRQLQIERSLASKLSESMELNARLRNGLAGSS